VEIGIDPHLRFEGISFFVCATQRSGSTLLCELLKGSDVAGVPDEYFERLRATGLPRQARQYFQDPAVAGIAAKLPPIDQGRTEQTGEFEGWFKYVLQRGTSRNGVFGSKMMWNYFDDFRERIRELPTLGEATLNQALDVLFPRLRIVFVRRRDKVAQAVSLWRAIQTQQWRNEVELPPDELVADYDYSAIKHLVDELHRWDARWEDWFHATGRQPIRVIYEEFVGARAATLGRVIDELGVDPREPECEVGPMRRQADDQSQDWVSRFRDDDAEGQLLL
jgi:trehalose 2-sulfotransferase